MNTIQVCASGVDYLDISRPSIERFAAKVGAKLDWHPYNHEGSSSFGEHPAWSKWSRLAEWVEKADQGDNILLIDGDTFVNQTAPDPFTGSWACIEIKQDGIGRWRAWCRKMGLESDRYFNVGVVCLTYDDAMTALTLILKRAPIGDFMMDQGLSASVLSSMPSVKKASQLWNWRTPHTYPFDRRAHVAHCAGKFDKRRYLERFRECMDEGRPWA